MNEYSAVECKIAEMFPAGQRVYYQGQEEIIMMSGKVKYKHQGEGKTDVYILFKSGKEIKISCKKSNADFIENKLKSVRARQIFGQECLPIKTAIHELSDLLNTINFYNEDAGSVLLGYRCDIINKKVGHLTQKLNLTTDQIQEIYFGSQVSNEGQANGRIIPNCGVANIVLLNAERLISPQEIINHLCKPEEIKEEYYLTLRGVNYYLNTQKYERSRTLAVPVNWADKGEPYFDVENSMNFTSADIYNKYWRN